MIIPAMIIMNTTTTGLMITPAMVMTDTTTIPAMTIPATITMGMATMGTGATTTPTTCEGSASAP